MEYVFGYSPRYGETVKVKDPDNVTLFEGQCIIERKYSDQIITDGFFVDRQVKYAEDSEGNKYAWYAISNHYRYTDKFTPGIIATEQEITEHDLAMLEAEQTITEGDLAMLEAEQEITDLDLRVMELELAKEE